jgi:hypothetical protein
MAGRSKRTGSDVERRGYLLKHVSSSIGWHHPGCGNPIRSLAERRS